MGRTVDKNITNRTVSQAKPKDKPFEIRDGGLQGLVLRVQPSGVMTYYFEYARGRRMLVGRADSLSPEQARDIAKGIEAQYRAGEDPMDKKRREETERQRQREAEAREKTYIQFLDEIYKPWLEIEEQSRIASGKARRHAKVAYDTLKKAFPELHNLKLNEITPGMIEQWRIRRQQEVTRDGKLVSETTINRQLSDLRACLNRAKSKWGLIQSNPVDDVEDSDRSDKRSIIRYLKPKEEEALRKALDEREEELKAGTRIYAPRRDLRKLTFADHLKPAVLLSLNTGLRRGELLKLKWEHVDFDQQNLTVVASTSKTSKTRHVPLNKEALSILRAWKDQPGVKSKYVFCDAEGQPFHDMRTSWEGVLSRAKITNFRWHDLRHTFASNLVMRDVSLTTVCELLGHSDYKMTLRYAHLAPEHKKAAVDKLVAPRNKSAAR